jgi:hypothetical protein
VLEAGEGLGGCALSLKLAPVWVVRQSGSQVSGPVRSSAAPWCRGVSVRVGSVAGSLGFGVSCFVAGAGCGGVAGLALGPGSNTALKLTWLSGSGKRQIARIR